MDFPRFRKTFSYTELANYMRSRFDLEDAIVERLIDEAIDGLALLQLTESDLRELGIRRMGTLKKILLLIRQNSSQTDPASDTHPVPQPNLHDSQISTAVLEVMKRIGNMQNQAPSSLKTSRRTSYGYAPPISPIGQISSTTPFNPNPIDVKPVIDLTSAISSTISSFSMNSPSSLSPPPSLSDMPWGEMSKTTDLQAPPHLLSPFIQSPSVSPLHPPDVADDSQEDQATTSGCHVSSVDESRISMTARRVKSARNTIRIPNTLFDAMLPQGSFNMQHQSDNGPCGNVQMSLTGMSRGTTTQRPQRKSAQPQKYVENETSSLLNDSETDQINSPELRKRLSQTSLDSLQSSSSVDPPNTSLSVPRHTPTRATSMETSSDSSNAHVFAPGQMTVTVLRPSTQRQQQSDYELPDGVTFENIDLRVEVSKMPGCRLVVFDLLRDGQKNAQAHRKFIQVATRILDMVSEKMGYKKYYPPSYIKSEMARAIIRNFPNFDSSKGDKAANLAYYDAADRTGYLENRYKTLRRGLDQYQRAYKPRTGMRRKNELEVDELMNFFAKD